MTQKLNRFQPIAEFNRNYDKEGILNLEENCRIDETGLLLPFILSPEERLKYFSHLKKISNILHEQEFTRKIKSNSPKLSELFFLH